MCEFDRRVVYCLLLTVTERHMKPCTQSAKAVSLSVPIISGTQTAAINTVVTVSKDNCTVSLSDTWAVVWCHCWWQL